VPVSQARGWLQGSTRPLGGASVGTTRQRHHLRDSSVTEPLSAVATALSSESLGSSQHGRNPIFEFSLAILGTRSPTSGPIPALPAARQVGRSSAGDDPKPMAKDSGPKILGAIFATRADEETGKRRKDKAQEESIGASQSCEQTWSGLLTRTGSSLARAPSRLASLDISYGQAAIWFSNKHES
jgi:hypothetical protein